MGKDHADTKQTLRRRMRAARASLSPDLVAELGAAVCARLLGLPSFLASRAVVAYAPIDNEVDPSAAVKATLAAGKAVYYPRRAPDGLEFLESDPAWLAPGRGAIPEPLDGSPLSAGTEGVVFLVPGVAFDPRGVRLGRGAGCYDRALARHPTALRVGLAYEMQVVPSLPEAAWDVPMDAVVTEARVLVRKETSP